MGGNIDSRIGRMSYNKNLIAEWNEKCKWELSHVYSKQTFVRTQSEVFNDIKLKNRTVVRKKERKNVHHIVRISYITHEVMTYCRLCCKENTRNEERQVKVMDKE